MCDSEMAVVIVKEKVQGPSIVNAAFPSFSNRIHCSNFDS